MSDQCPEAKSIGELQSTVRALEKSNSRLHNELEKLKAGILLNAEARIYSDGVKEGKRATDQKPFNYINKLITMVGSGVVLLVVMLLIYVVAGAEQAISFVKAIYEAFT